MKELALIECVGAIQLDRRPRPKERLGSSRGCQLKAECPSTDSRLAYVLYVQYMDYKYVLHQYLEPTCLSLPSKRRTFQSKQGSFGFQAYITFLFSQHDLCPHALLSEQGVRNRVMFGDRTLPDLAYTVYCI